MRTDAQVAVAAALAGAEVVRARYGKSLARFDKGAGDFATAADIESEQVILDVIRSARPGDAVVGEETGRTGESDRVWLVDPLCGTLNFAAQTPLVGVNVALRDGPAACADPFSGEVFWTDGERAYLGDEALVPSARSRLVEVDLDTGSATLGVFTDAEFRKLFSPRVVSTTLALAWVAAGRRAAYLVDRDLRDNVHFAAGIALCRAAGCVVTGIRGQPLHTGAGGLIAAADAETHRALLTLVERHFPQKTARPDG